jgi:3-hydroxyacyl-[acyl-carrier-protein] dehydratase
MNKIKQEIMAAAVAAICCDDAQTVTRCYSFAPGFAGFSGHFPGNPILPAIVQLLTVVSLIEEHSGKEQQLMAVEDAKFLNPVLPDQEILIQCRQRTIAGKIRHDAQLSVAGKPVATFLLHLETRGSTP